MGQVGVFVRTGALEFESYQYPSAQGLGAPYLAVHLGLLELCILLVTIC